ncbi:MAG: thioesterase [Oscillospiraceae bacterium]|nr:thioesterase [Oscillospiraceae bacterium]
MYGYGPANMRETKYAWILLNWKLKVFSRPAWNEKITIKTWPRAFNRCYSYRDLEMYDEDGNLVAIAASRWTLVSLETNSICKVPPEMAEKYSMFDKSLFEEPVFNKLHEPESSKLKFEQIAGRRDIDTNRHVNNISYISYAYEALPQEVYDRCSF